MRCVNCGLCLAHRARRSVDNIEVRHRMILQQWIGNAELGSICPECLHILEAIPEDSLVIPARAYGHTFICLGCGMALRGRRHVIVGETTGEMQIIRAWPEVPQIAANTRVCRGCWLKANRQAQRHDILDEGRAELAVPADAGDLPLPLLGEINDVTCMACLLQMRRHHLNRACLGCGVGLADYYRNEPDAGEENEDQLLCANEVAPQEPAAEVPGEFAPLEPPQPPPLPNHLLFHDIVARPIEKIHLPDYKRVASTSRHCVFVGCNNFPLVLIPRIIKIRLLVDFNLYIPICARICPQHLQDHNWIQLQEEAEYNDFTAFQIQHKYKMFKEHAGNKNDFTNIRDMGPHLCRYWFGRTAEEFFEILQEVPSLQNSELSLAMFLIKLRTGDSNDRLASLFKVSRSTLKRHLNKAREALTQDFLPHHLGTGHLTIQDVARKNKVIPNGLFGEPHLPEDIRPAIIICDGTYIYIQKSSNYAFQKKTYSLHKYKNLVKPFLIVCCDGYIIDAIGPYAAVESDAKIMRDLFADENGEMRAYFRENDVFVLDRGFRDVIPFLQMNGYGAHMPESKDNDATQLSTIQANKSRFVTLVRWVVEVVNGRFKRDFKIFRQDYFNPAVPHLMQDFRICAALINKFHLLIEDRPYAQEIVNIALVRKDLPNYLGNHIVEHNLNRRRVVFNDITADNEQLNNFPRLTLHDLTIFALGIYQLKQARSYYGEHIRERGAYNIEVCPDLDFLITNNPSLRGDNYLLRGRIKSRHTGRKVYYTYLLVSRDLEYANRLDAIKGYYCSCLVGNRTVGCCAHVMTVLWYLSWARHQNQLDPPAEFLDYILVTEEHDNDEDVIE